MFFFSDPIHVFWLLASGTLELTFRFYFSLECKQLFLNFHHDFFETLVLTFLFLLRNIFIKYTRQKLNEKMVKRNAHGVGLLKMKYARCCPFLKHKRFTGERSMCTCNQLKIFYSSE